MQVQAAAGIGQEIQEWYYTNKFLAQMNKELFIPKRLYTMIVTYKTSGSDQPEVGIERVDLGATAIAKYGGEVQPDTTVAESGSSEEPKMLEDVKEKMKQLQWRDPRRGRDVCHLCTAHLSCPRRRCGCFS